MSDTDGFLECPAVADHHLMLSCGMCDYVAPDVDRAPRGRPLDLWNARTTSSGVFTEAKASGDVFAGAVCEDDPHRDCRHRIYALAFLCVLAVAGLVYLNWWVARRG